MEIDRNRKRFVVIVPDGVGDYAIPELGGQTVLEAAHIPHIDALARGGIVGSVQTIPGHLPAGSDVANLSLLGFDPVEYYTGRSPLEAANIGVDLGAEDISYRCNLVALQDGRMADFSAGHISTQEASELIRFLDKELGTDDVHFYPGTSYRHLMVWSGGREDIECTPPHDITGREFLPYLPKGAGAERLLDMIERSQGLLAGHPVNAARIKAGKLPATSIWLWGQGRRPALPKFIDYFGLNGGIISAVDLLKGLGRYLGLEIIDVPGITGYLDTNYEGKGEYAINALRHLDFVFIHIEATDEAGHNGDCRAKVGAIEAIDKFIVGKIIQGLEGFPHHSVLIIPDHFTPVSVRTHTREPVPFCLYSSDKRFNENGVIDSFNETTASKSVVRFSKGPELIRFFFKST